MVGWLLSGERRGVGGIFFDDLDIPDQDSVFAFVKVEKPVLSSYHQYSWSFFSSVLLLEIVFKVVMLVTGNIVLFDLYSTFILLIKQY